MWTCNGCLRWWLVLCWLGVASDALSLWSRLGQRSQAVHGVVVNVSRGARIRPSPPISGVHRQLHAVLRQAGLHGRSRGTRRGHGGLQHAHSAETQGTRCQQLARELVKTSTTEYTTGGLNPLT